MLARMALCCAATLAPTGATAEDTIPPREALRLMYEEMAAHPERQRRENTNPFAARVETDGLTEAERFILGEVYFVNLMPKEAEETFRPFMSGSGVEARIAWQRVMQILFRAYSKTQDVAGMVEEYREKFPPSPADPYALYGQVQNLGSHYRAGGNHERVVELVTEEVRSLPADAPYQSWLLPGYFMKSFEAVGKRDEAVGMLREARGHLEELAAPASLSEGPEGYYRIEDFMALRGFHSERTAGWRFQKLVESTTERIDRYLAES